MANSDKNLVITPNIGAASDPKIVFSGADASTAAQNITITAYPTNGGTLSFDGSTGQLFSVTNSMSGTIFSANDVSGIPSIEVIDTGLVKIAQYSGNLLLGSGTDTGLAKLQVTGSLSITGNMLYPTNSKSIYGPNTTWSSYLHVGGDGINGIARTGSIASVVTTNGNLHLDSGSDKAMYLNHYSGTGGIQFGNGASGITATLTGAGVFNGTNVTVNGNQTLHAGNYTSYAPSLTGGGASGTWGISVTGTAGSISGYNNPTTAATANTIAYRDGAGDISAREIVLSSGLSASVPTVLVSMFPTTNQMVRTTPAAVASAIQSGASGTWGISVTGNATTATTAPKLNHGDGPRDLSNRSPSWNSRSTTFDFVGAGTGNGTGNYAGVMTFVPWDGTSASTGDSSYQLAFANQSGVNASGPARLSVRNGINTTWNSWQEILTSSNYNSYAPTLTGGGASGTWGISITGNSTSTSQTAFSDLTITGAAHKYLYINPGNGYEAMVRYNGGSGSGWYAGKRTIIQTVGTESFHFYSEAAAKTVVGIDTGGNIIAVGDITVGLGKTSSNIYMSDSDEGQRQLHCNSNRIGFLNQSGGWGSYCSDDGSWTSDFNITAYSDIKLKENIVTIDSALSKTLSLRGVFYNRIDKDDKTRKVGVIAQEIQEILPEVVSANYDKADDSTTLSVDYGNISALLIEAIKEQQTIIDSQESRIARLEALVSKLIEG